MNGAKDNGTGTQVGLTNFFTTASPNAYLCSNLLDCTKASATTYGALFYYLAPQ